MINNLQTPISEKDILNMIRNSIKIPFSKICKHTIALDLVELLEAHGYKLGDELVFAIAQADDATALGILNKMLDN